MKITPSQYVSDYEIVARTRKERLLSLPWKPWSKFKTIHSPKAYFVGDMIVCSFSTYNKLNDNDSQ